MKKWECVRGNTVGYAEFWSIEEDGLTIGNFYNHSDAQRASAAPELLEALQGLISGYEHRGSSGMFDMLCHGDEIEAAVKAINKALGKNDGEE